MWANSSEFAHTLLLPVSNLIACDQSTQHRQPSRRRCRDGQRPCPAPPHGRQGRRRHRRRRALAPLATAPAAHAPTGPAFLHGVASGDPLPDGVLLWTRVTPTPDAVPGSGKGPDTASRWEVAEDKDFPQIVAHGTTTPGPPPTTPSRPT